MCAWVYPEWLRWFPVIEVFEVETSAPGWENQRLLSCFINENKGILDFRAEFIKVQNSEFTEIHIEVFKMNSSFALQNILRFFSSIKMKILFITEGLLEGGTDFVSLLTMTRMRPKCRSVGKFPL